MGRGSCGPMEGNIIAGVCVCVYVCPCVSMCVRACVCVCDISDKTL